MKNLLELTFIALLGYGWNSWLNKFVSLPLGGGNYIDAVIVALFTTPALIGFLTGYRHLPLFTAQLLSLLLLPTASQGTPTFYLLCLALVPLTVAVPGWHLGKAASAERHPTAPSTL